MYLSTLGLAPLLFALGTRATTYIATTPLIDGSEAILRGCYANVGFSFFDTTGGSSGSFYATQGAASVNSCAQQCRNGGYTYSMIQGAGGN